MFINIKKLIVLIIVTLSILMPNCAMSNSINNTDSIQESIEKEIEKQYKRESRRTERYEIQQQLEQQKHRIDTDADELVKDELKRLKFIERLNNLKNRQKSKIIIQGENTDDIETTVSDSLKYISYLNIEFPTTPSCIYKTENNIDINIIDFKNAIVSRLNSDEYSGSIVYEINNATSINYNDLKISLKLIDSSGNEYSASFDKMPKNDENVKQGVSFFEKIPFDNYRLVVSLR